MTSALDGRKIPIWFAKYAVIPGTWVRLTVALFVLLSCAGCAEYPATIATTQLPAARAGVPYASSLKGMGGIPPYRWGVATGGLPPGLKLNAKSGELSGIPARIGTFKFTVQLSDSMTPKPHTSARAISVIVDSPSPHITTEVLPNAQVGVQSQANLTATGGVQPYCWTISSGTLPSGIFLNATTGVISGKASQGGEFDFSAQVSDSSSPTPQIAMKPLRLSVVAFALQIISGGLPSGQLGVPFQASVTGNGGVMPYTWAVAGALPSGLSLNASSGVITGAPTQPGTSAFTILLKDSAGQTAQKSSSIMIAAGPGSLAITTTSLSKPTVGQTYSQTLQATGGTSPYTWSVASGQLPVGLALSPAGQLAGTPTAAGQSSFTVQVADSASPPLTASQALSVSTTDDSKRPATDQYGGLLALASPRGATGQWRVEKFGNRWLFVTPDGHGFWHMGVSAVDGSGSTPDQGISYDQIVAQKYGSDKFLWANQSLKRLTSWGFNSLDENPSTYAMPFGRPQGALLLPMVFGEKPSWYGLTNWQNYGPGPFKSLEDCLDSAVYRGYIGNGPPDVFDPNFDGYVDGLLNATSKDPFWSQTLISRWVIGISMDDADQMQGFGAGPEIPGADGVIVVHIGWVALAASPTKASSGRYGVTYADPTVFTKRALHDMLVAKYGTIAALNAAWGSNYTTFDSAGGWGIGTGLMDENGRHTAWLGNSDGTLSSGTISPAVQTDLDSFLYSYAVKYFSVQVARYRQHAPGKLVFGPAPLNGHGGLTRKQVLQAAGQFLDVVEIGILNQQILDKTVQYMGDLPMETWEGLVANPDSSLWRYPNPATNFVNADQRTRGNQYINRLDFLSTATTTSGQTTTRPIAGFSWWQWCDNWSEKLNWGLVSFRDNAYDGTEATITSGVDPWGYRTGGEERNYGDFISVVRSTNSQLLKSLLP